MDRRFGSRGNNKIYQAPEVEISTKTKVVVKRSENVDSMDTRYMLYFVADYTRRRKIIYFVGQE